MVITTYDTLRADLDHDKPAEKSLRKRKRYRSHLSPLTRIQWRRVILDEAQMVESSTTAAAEMALRLSADFRWCVTGTPLSTGVDELYGLLLFLGVQPWADKNVWRSAISPGGPAACAMLKAVIGEVMWRSTKSQVAAELGLPPQTAKTVKLTLSHIEREFYKIQMQECANAARKLLAMHGDEPASTVLNARNAKSFLASMLRLRQACCHPQVGSHAVRSLRSTTMTMGELLDELITKAVTQDEDNMRVAVSAANGLAAIATIQEDPGTAAELYATVLRMARMGHLQWSAAVKRAVEAAEQAEQQAGHFDTVEAKKKAEVARAHADKLIQKKQGWKGCGEWPDCDAIGCQLTPTDPLDILPPRVDPFLQLHAATHLIQLNPSLETGLSHIAKSIQDEYESAAAATVSRGERALGELQRRLSSESLEDAWWLDAIDKFVANGNTDDMFERISNELLQGSSQVRGQLSRQSWDSILWQIDGQVPALCFTLTTSLDRIRSTRSAAVQAISQLPRDPTPSQVVAAVSCARCRQFGSGPECVYCLAQEVIWQYWQQVFQVKELWEKRQVKSGELPQEAGQSSVFDATSEVKGRKDCEAVRVLRLLARGLRGEPDLSARAKGFLEQYEMCKKEAMGLNMLWRALRDHISIRDELVQAKMRLEVIPNDQPIADHEQLYKIHRFGLDTRKVELQARLHSL